MDNSVIKFENIEFKLMFSLRGKEFYRSGDRMVEVFPEGYLLSQLLAEAENQSFAHESGLPAPEIFEVTSLGGRWAIVSELVGQRLLSDIVKADGMNDELLDKFTALQNAIHSKKSYELHKQRENTHRLLGDSPLNPTVRYELHTLLDTLPKHNKLCHGRFLPSSVIVSESGQLYAIDWAHARQGNASCDAAFTYLSLLLDCGTELAERYLTSFCKKSEIAKDYIEKWETIVAASMLKDRGAEGQKILKKIIEK